MLQSITIQPYPLQPLFLQYFSDQVRRRAGRLPSPVRIKSIKDADTTSNTEQQTAALIQSSAKCIAAYEPPDYLIDGLLQRRFCYSLTAHKRQTYYDSLALCKHRCWIVGGGSKAVVCRCDALDTLLRP
jgi:hypothetical protein